jgi:hypothetical protein
MKCDVAPSLRSCQYLVALSTEGLSTELGPKQRVAYHLCDEERNGPIHQQANVPLLYGPITARLMTYEKCTHCDCTLQVSTLKYSDSSEGSK